VVRCSVADQPAAQEMLVDIIASTTDTCRRNAMSMVRRTAVVAALALACTTVGVGLIPSAEGAGNASKTYRVQGVQQPVGDSIDLYAVKSDKGHPGLVGDWVVTRTHKIDSALPWYFETGTEQFTGCLDVNGDNRCRGREPAGQITFDYASWGEYDLNWAELLGGCVHPITGGTGAFQGVQGLVTMSDTPRPDGTILTTYRGNVTLSSRAGAAAQPDSTLPESLSAPAGANAADAAAPVHPRVC
jgi:hypothetical protein